MTHYRFNPKKIPDAAYFKLLLEKAAKQDRKNKETKKND